MQVIDSWEGIKELAKNLPKDKKIFRLVLSGPVHIGHIYLLQSIKNSDPDCLVVAHYNEMLHFQAAMLMFPYTYGIKVDYQKIIDSFNEFHFKPDYVLLTKVPENFALREKKRIMIQEDYKKRMKPVAERLNLSESLSIECMMFHVTRDPLTPFITERFGPKCSAPALIHQKVFPEMYTDIDITLKTCETQQFYKTEEGDVITRSKSPTLRGVRKDAVEALKNGEKNGKVLENLMNKYFLMGKKFTIIDIDTVEKIDNVNDNCIIIYMDAFTYEFIFNRNGKLIY